MGVFRHNPETGQREYVEHHHPEEPAPADPPPAPRDNFVERFVSGWPPQHPAPPPPRPRGPGGRPYRRAYPRRRG